MSAAELFPVGTTVYCTVHMETEDWIYTAEVVGHTPKRVKIRHASSGRTSLAELDETTLHTGPALWCGGEFWTVLP